MMNNGNGAGKKSIALRGENLWFEYPRKGGWVLQGVSLAVPEGEFWTVAGSSGTGKTTLMKVLAGMLVPQQGRVEVLGRAVNGNGVPADLRLQMGYIPQQLGLVRGLTAMENVLMGSLGRSGGVRTLLGYFPRGEREQAREYLALLGIEHKAGEKAFRLSGGERQRVAIARTLFQGPKIIFADEFISDLDLPRAAQVLGQMRDLGREAGLTFLINLHEVELIRECADRAVVLRGGKVVHEGAGGEFSGEMLGELLR